MKLASPVRRFATTTTAFAIAGSGLAAQQRQAPPPRDPGGRPPVRVAAAPVRTLEDVLGSAAGKIDPARAFVEFFSDAETAQRYAALPANDPERTTILGAAGKVWLGRELDKAVAQAKTDGRSVAREELQRELVAKLGTAADLERYDAAEPTNKEHFALAVGIWKYVPGSRPAGM